MNETPSVKIIGEDPRERTIRVQADLEIEERLHAYGTVTTGAVGLFTLKVNRVFDFWDVLDYIRELERMAP